MSYVELPVETDPAALADAAVSYLTENIPGFELVDGHLEAFLIEALARLTVEASSIAAQMPSAAFREFGAQFLDLEQGVGAEATIVTTWTVQDTSGWTVPANTLVGYRRTGDDSVLFEVVDAIVVPAGIDYVNGVVLRAVEAGESSNAVPVGALELVDSLSFVDSCVATEVSSGGEDPETDTAYQDRLRTELLLMSPRPILPEDFAVLAQRVDGVGRALALNLYDPGTGTWDNERYCTVAVVDEDGAACSSPVKAEVLAYLDALREVNFVVCVMDPEFTTVNVSAIVKVWDGYLEADVLTAVESAVAEWLSPATWAGGDQSPPVWMTGYGTVRYLQLVRVVADVEGVEYVTAVGMNGGTADVVLEGDAPLPRAGTISVTAGASGSICWGAVDVSMTTSCTAAGLLTPATGAAAMSTTTTCTPAGRMSMSGSAEMTTIGSVTASGTVS